MNEVDKQIVNLMELQGFQTTKLIASSIGVAERTVRRHLDGMIKRRMIKVVPLLNSVLCGFKAWSIIGIKTEPGHLEHVAHSLVEHPAVFFAAYALGRFDVIISVLFDTIDKLVYFVNIKLARLKGIVSSETWMVASPRKYYSFSWPAPVFGESKARIHNYEPIVDNKNYQITALDRDIIAILKKDGLARPAAIKSKLSLGESTIRKRIKHMLDNNLYKREVVLRPQILEKEIWAMIGITTTGRDAYEVIDTILKYPHVCFASVSLGRFNVLIASRFHNMELLNQFVTTELTSINGIGSTETFVHNKILKYLNIRLDEFQADE